MEQQEISLERSHLHEQSSIQSGSYAKGAIEAIHEREIDSLHRRAALQERRENMQLGFQVLNEGVESFRRFSDERFQKAPDAERQAHGLIRRLTSAAYERVCLMGIKFEELDLLFKDPGIEIPPRFDRAFFPLRASSKTPSDEKATLASAQAELTNTASYAFESAPYPTGSDALD